MPRIYITDVPRTTTRAMWKFIYRLYRISAREAEKAYMDTVIYGTGVVKFDEGEPRHIPYEEFAAAGGFR